MPRSLVLQTLAPVGLLCCVLAPARANETAQQLDEVEKLAAASDFSTTFHNQHRRALEALQGSGAKDKLAARLRSVDERLAASAGPLAVRALGDGRRATAANASARELLERGLYTCRRIDKNASGKEIAEQYAEYEKLVAKAGKIDEASLRFAGELGGAMSWHDVPLEIALCEIKVAGLRMGADDDYEAARPSGNRVTGCGYSDYPMEKPKHGGSWSSSGTPLGGVALSCAAFPKASKVPADMKPILASEFPGLTKKDVVVLVDKVDEETRARLAVVGKDLYAQTRDYKTAILRIYSKDTVVVTNECGETDARIACEAAGSNGARAFNQLRHYAARADLHRKAGRRDRCKEMSKRGAEAYEAFASFRKDALANGSWKKGLRYKTTAGVVAEPELVSGIERMGKEADEHMTSAWCDAR